MEQGDSSNRKMSEKGSSKAKPLSYSIQTITPFFLLSGVYINASKRNKILDLMLRVYSSTLILLQFCLFCHDLADLLLTNGEMELIVYKTARSIVTFNLPVANVLWLWIMKNMQNCFISIEKMNAFSSKQTHLKLSRGLMLLKVLLGMSIMIHFGTLVCYLYSAFQNLLLTGDEQVYDTMTHLKFPFSLLLFKVRSVLACFMRFYLMNNTVLFHSLFVFVCFLVSLVICAHNHTLQTALSSTTKLSAETIEKLRQNYEECIKVVKDLDGYFSKFIGMSLLCQTSSICLAIYLDAASISDFNKHGYYLIASLLFLVMTIVPSTVIWNQVRIISIIIFALNSSLVLLLTLLILDNTSVNCTISHQVFPMIMFQDYHKRLVFPLKQ